MINLPPCPSWCTLDHDPGDDGRFCETSHVEVPARSEDDDTVAIVFVERYAGEGTLEQCIRVTKPRRIGLGFTPADARRLAAALLDGADTLDPPTR